MVELLLTGSGFEIGSAIRSLFILPYIIFMLVKYGAYFGTMKLLIGNRHSAWKNVIIVFLVLLVLDILFIIFMPFIIYFLGFKLG